MAPIEPHTAAPPHRLPRRDGLLVLAVSLAVAVLAARFQWSERVFAATRRLETVQLDELALVACTVAIGLAWLSWRRTRLAERQLQARLQAEQQRDEALRANQRQAHEYLRSLETERKHLARELHDELGQYSNAIKLDALAIADSTPAVATAAQRIVQAADHLHGVVGQLIRQLRPAGLDELGLVAALEGCIDRWQQTLADTAIELQVEGDFDELGELAKLTLYRSLQEGLTNCARHAAASRIQVQLSRHPDPSTGVDRLRLQISDDGKGCSPARLAAGYGLRGMRERLALMGGTLQVHAAPAGGLHLTADLPATGHE